MKKIKVFILLALALAAVSCSEEDLDSKSIFDTSSPERNAFETWILNNYTEPYNIDLKYRFEDIESDMKYNVTPAAYDKSVALAKLVKYLWIEAYEELVGQEFVATYCPKVLHFVGSPEYEKSGGCMVLGTAEGGLKITLFNVDALQIATIDASTNYFKTIHHEFGHILNQTKPYTTDFKEITGTLYVGDSCWDTYKTDASALQVGLISRYAGSEDTEDFVELISIYVTRPQEAWDKLLTTAGADGAAIINQKFEIVRNYLQNSWNINIDELRESVLRRADEVPDMDLESLDD